MTKAARTPYAPPMLAWKIVGSLSLVALVAIFIILCFRSLLNFQAQSLLQPKSNTRFNAAGFCENAPAGPAFGNLISMYQAG